METMISIASDLGLDCSELNLSVLIYSTILKSGVAFLLTISHLIEYLPVIYL